MNNNIDNLLNEISSDVPKVNPYLQNKIYNTAMDKKSKKSFSFFKNPLVITFSSIFVFLVLLVGALNLRNIPFNDIQQPDSGASSIYVPTLSPNEQNTVFIDFHYAVYTDEYACITLVINNKIDYQTIYIKNYGKTIENVQLNNGDVSISEVFIGKESFFKIEFNNTNTTIHYIDLCYKTSVLDELLKQNKVIEFILYIETVQIDKGYGYEFEIEQVYDLRKENNL